MSLKAKIEAVIYASEEPVTLAQLVGLLGHEAQAELDRQQSDQQSLNLDLDSISAPNTNPAGELTSAAEATSAGQLTEPGDPDALDQEILNPAKVELAEPAPVLPPAEAAAPEPESEVARKKITDAEKLAARRLRDHFRAHLDQLIADYAAPDRGLEIREVAGGYRLATKPEYHDAVRGFVKSLKPALKLTLQSLETLAVVAYKQPVTAPEISEIRGVDSGGVLGSLMARKLITTAGRKQVIGRPILYKTTKDFLLRFGLKDVAELPSIEEFEKMAGELADTESSDLPLESAQNSPLQEETDMSDTARPHDPTITQHREEENAVEPQGDGSGNVADEIVVDGRISGLPPNYDRDNDDDPSAREAGEQNSRRNESQE